MRIKDANVFSEHGFIKKDIYIDGEYICESLEVSDNSVLDASGLYAIPGLVDIHFHGAKGFDICDADENALLSIADYEALNGVLTLCPATMTIQKEKLLNVMRTISSHKNERGADYAGINLEGPFISKEKLGAQNPDYVLNPSDELFDMLQNASNGLIKLVDLAPETEGAFDFIKKYKDKVHISIAHTVSDYDKAKEAFMLGADHLTHLYNAMPPLLHRMPGPIAAASEKNAYVELIADGIHVHPAMVRLAFKIFDKDKIVFISDSMRATGLPNGTYDLGGLDVDVQGKSAVLSASPGTIAGSVTNLFECVKNAVLNMEIPLWDAVCAATINPSKSIGIDELYGSLDAGKYGNIILMNDRFEIKNIISHGKVIK